jgi:hypothetical protein
LPDVVERGSADRGESQRSGAGSHATCILRERHIANVEQAVLDLPVVAGKLQQCSRIELVGGQAGDGVDHLARAAVLQLAQSLDAANRCKAGPILVETKRQLGAHLDAPRLDATVALFDGFGALQVGRITPRDGLTGNGCDHVVRGKRHRGRVRPRPAARAGWL